MLARILGGLESVLRRKKKVVPAQVRQILVIEFMLPLGCVVHMTPAFEAIKRSLPDVVVIVATRGIGLQVLRHSPFVDRLIEAPDPTKDLWGAVRTLRRELRSRGLRPDCVLTGVGDQRTRLALMGLLASDGWRGGFTIHPELYQRPLTNDPELSVIGNNLRVAQLLGADFLPKEPRVFFSEEESRVAVSLLREANPAQLPVVVMVTQTSGGQPTNWHVERFAQVVRKTVQRGCAVIYVGTAADGRAIETLREAAGGQGVSLAGRTTVGELAALLAASDFVVTLDTGTLHIGRSVGVPMVVLATPWQKTLDWMPLDSANVRILRGPDRAEVPADYKLDEISVESVIATLDELMAMYPSSADQRQRRLQGGLSEVDHLASSQEVPRQISVAPASRAG